MSRVCCQKPVPVCEDSVSDETAEEESEFEDDDINDCEEDVFAFEDPCVQDCELWQVPDDHAEEFKCQEQTDEVKIDAIGEQNESAFGAIVIDPGSSFIKAGISNVHTSPIAYHTLVGRPKPTMTYTLGTNSNKADVRYLEEAWNSKELCNFKYPIERGIVTNWDDMEEIYKIIFDDLESDCGDEAMPVLITEQPLNPRAGREKLAEIMFETLDVPAFFVAVPAVLSLFSTGRTTGCVVESGSGVTHTVPVYEGYTIPCNINRITVGGEDITRYLMRLVTGQDCVDITTFKQRCALSCAKENLCFVSLDYERDMCGKSDCKLRQKFIMEDVNNSGEITVTMTKQRFRAPEALFKPGLLGKMHMPLHEAIYDTIKRSDECIQRILYSNIFLSGGNTLFRNLDCRLQRELKEFDNDSVKVQVFSDRRRKHAAWLGGAILGSMESFTEMWIAKCEYEEEGVAVVKRKCF